MKLQFWGSAAVAFLVLINSQIRPAIGRPQNVKTFGKTYEKEYANANVEFRCTVCHLDGEKKTVHNNYGDALKKVMAEKKLDGKNAAMVEKALREVESLPSAIPNKSFGDLIKDGKLPASTN
ncbi:MAG: hypothetical protein JSS49_14845 [Planctomycetes bacterium]|nr:hypothetical protein [Planctomycetota bacterium]